jgi:16S rRNA (cytosine967-C5)-methyltransferase
VIAFNDRKKTDVRQSATEILLKVDSRKAYANLLLDHVLRHAAIVERDRALLTELVYGTLRWRGKIDALLKLYLNRSLTDADPFIRNLLRVTLYQLLFLDKVPDYAAVHERGSPQFSQREGQSRRHSKSQ